MANHLECFNDRLREKYAGNAEDVERIKSSAKKCLNKLAKIL